MSASIRANSFYADAPTGSGQRWSGVVSKSGDTAPRTVRPHTAHGTRSIDASAEVFASPGAFLGGGEAAPVVAGARGVMRWVCSTDVVAVYVTFIESDKNRKQVLVASYYASINHFDNLFGPLHFPSPLQSTVQTKITRKEVETCTTQ